MIFTICLIIMNITLRKTKLIKSSSPKINTIILLGCFLLYTSLFLSELHPPKHTLNMCRARYTCILLGFSAVFGGLFSKTWRVHKIFTAVKLRKKPISDVQLLGLFWL